MLKFGPITKENSKEIQKYLSKEYLPFCERTIGVKIMWQNYFKDEYAIYKNTLILKNTTHLYNSAFFLPVGENVLESLEKIEEYVKENKMPLRFCNLTESEVNFLKERYKNTSTNFYKRFCDYVYNIEDFNGFKGKKFHAQKNNLNKFLKSYKNVRVEEITERALPKIYQFLDDLYSEELDHHKRQEITYSKILIDKFFDLNFEGLLLTDAGKIIALMVGEITKNELVVHIEKVNKKYSGINQALIYYYAKKYIGYGIEKINREDDCNLENLRISKLRYNPIELREKYVLTVHNAMINLMPFGITIKTDRLLLSDLKKEDSENYYNLVVNERLNRYWGYDYKDDLQNNAPTPEYFYTLQQKCKIEKEEYSLAITKNNEYIGEGVFWNGDIYGGIEIGVRLIEEAQNKGYGKEVYNALKNYLLKIPNIKRVKSRCNKQNTPSYKMILACGFKKCGEDSTYYYFEYLKNQNSF